MMDRLECVAPVGDQCGEAATWVPEEQALYWTDVNRFLVHRMRLESRAVETWQFDEPCVALFLTDVPGTMLLALGSRIVRWQPDTNQHDDLGFHLDDWPRVRLNDGRPGPGGEIWIGSMANNVGKDGTPGDVIGAHGALFRLRPGNTAVTMKDGIGISNTVCFSPDRRHFYFGDTPRNVIWRFDYDLATRTVSNEVPFFEGFDRGLPDGSTIDADGCLWNCRFGGDCVVRVTPDGEVDEVLDMPVSNVTTCEFGGPDLATLYITTAAMLTDRYERLAGSVFAFQAPAGGLPPLRVAISQ